MTRPITGTVYYPDGTPWASGEVRAYYVPRGDWANVRHVTR